MDTFGNGTVGSVVVLSFTTVSLCIRAVPTLESVRHFVFATNRRLRNTADTRLFVHS